MRGRPRVRGGLGGRRAHGGGQDGAAQDHAAAGEPRGAGFSGGQQAGPAQRFASVRGGADAGLERARLPHSLAPPTGMRHHRGRPTGRPRAAAFHDHQEEKDDEAPEAKKMTLLMCCERDVMVASVMALLMCLCGPTLLELSVQRTEFYQSGGAG